MYSNFRTIVKEGQDAGCSNEVFDVAFSQSLDLKAADLTLVVNPGDAETQISLPITTIYRLALASTAPVLVRFNGNAATQFTLTNSSAAGLNSGSNNPFIISAVFPMKITSVYFAPVSGASTAATIRLFAAGDPQTAY